MGCAIAAFACYFTMMATSYAVGRFKYPIDYHVKRLLLYFAIAGILYAAAILAGHSMAMVQLYFQGTAYRCISGRRM